MQNRITNEYFEWLYAWMCGLKRSKTSSFRKLLTHLHKIEFSYSIPNDVNRAEDGVDLRYRFALEQGYSDVPDGLEGPCSVFELIAAIAIRCEETIMANPDIGDRTSQWFWCMISNLGLGSMTDDRFDVQYVDDVILRFMNREYEPDGTGGLFKIKNCKYDLRDVEIWYQLNWYLDNFV